VGIHEVQNGLGLSSPSVAHYHIRKLVEEGLVKEGQSGYLVDKVLFENMIRIKKSIIPVQAAYLTLFLSSLAVLLIFLRAPTISGDYLFAIFLSLMGIVIFSLETTKMFRRKICKVP